MSKSECVVLMTSFPEATWTGGRGRAFSYQCCQLLDNCGESGDQNLVLTAIDHLLKLPMQHYAALL